MKKKNDFGLRQLPLALALLFVVSSCKKEPLEVHVNFLSLELVGEEVIYYTGQIEVVANKRKYDINGAGIYWGTSPDPVNTGTRQADGNTAQFNGEKGDLSVATTYYLQPFAIVNDVEYVGEVSTVSTGPGWAAVPSSPSVPCAHLAIAPSGILHAVGDGGAHFYSANQGTSWTQVTHVNGEDLSEPKFIDENVMLMVTPTSIRKSTNGGLNWTNFPLPVTDPVAVFFYDATTWSVSKEDSIYTTSNEGADWTAAFNIDLGDEGEARAIYFLSPTDGFAVSEGGDVSKTTDGGDSWVQINVTNFGDNSDSGTALWFLNSTTGFLGFGEYIFGTPNGGTHWEYQEAYAAIDPNEIVFCNATDGLVAGSGLIARTRDGGETWTTEEMPVYGVYNDVVMLSADICYAIKSNGSIYCYKP
jgi:photosystem II stability/assembly factor-like uncharacterized protein